MGAEVDPTNADEVIARRHGSRSIPLASLKDREHRSEPFRVPLSPRAVEIAREMERARISAFAPKVAIR
jgi:hypothetical protein